MNTLLRYTTGLETDTFEQNLWKGQLYKYGHRSIREVTKIEPENNLIHAIGYDETNIRSYTYETLVIGGDYSQ